MSSFTSKFARYKSDEIRGGEEHLYSIVGQPQGSLSGSLNKLGDNRTIEAVGDLTSRQEESTMAGQVERKNSYVTLTSKRVLFHPTTFLGKPKERSAEFPIEEVTSMDSSDRSTLEIGFADGSALVFNLLSRQSPSRLVELFDGLGSPD